MSGINYTIISERMVWIWYYDELGGKHLKELLADEARAFVQKLEGSTDITLSGMNFLNNLKSATN